MIFVFVSFCIQNIILAQLSKRDETELSENIGYIVVNLTSTPAIRTEIAEKHLARLLPLISIDDQIRLRSIVIDIVRNLSFDDGNFFA